MSDVVTVDVLEKKFDDFGVKLFKYLDERFGEVERRLDALDDKYDKLMTTLDAF